MIMKLKNTHSCPKITPFNLLIPKLLTFYLRTYDFPLRHFNKHLVCILHMSEQSLIWVILLTPTYMQALPIIEQPKASTNSTNKKQESSKFRIGKTREKWKKTYLWEE